MWKIENVVAVQEKSLNLVRGGSSYGHFDGKYECSGNYKGQENYKCLEIIIVGTVRDLSIDFSNRAETYLERRGLKFGFRFTENH